MKGSQIIIILWLLIFFGMPLCITNILHLVIIIISVPEFEASKYLVSNREYLTFVEDGGYQRKELWTEEGMHSTCMSTKLNLFNRMELGELSSGETPDLLGVQ